MEKLLKFLEEKGLFWGIAFLLFFIPIYPKFPLLAVPGTYVAIRLEDFLVASILGLWGILGLLGVIRGRKRLFFPGLWPLFLIYFLVGGLSILSAIFITKNIVPHIAFLHFLRRIEYMSLLFAAYYSLHRTKDIKILAASLSLATVGVFIYGVGQKFFGWPVVSTMNKEFSKGMILKLTWWARVNSTFAGHYDLAAFLVLILALSVAFFVAVKNWRARIFVIFLAIVSYYLLILTASRISFAAYLLAVAFVLLALNKRWWVVPVLGLSIIGMLLSSEFSQRYASTFKINLSFLSGAVKVKPKEISLALPPTPTLVSGVSGLVVKPLKLGEPTPTPTPTPTPLPPAEPIESTEMAVARSTDIRLKVEWPRAARAFAKNPLLGTGYSSITLATDNDYLRILGETGILGALAFLAIFLEIGRQVFLFWRKSKPGFERAIVLGICGAALGLFLNAAFIDVFEASKIAFIFWILMGVMLKTIDLSSLKHENIKTLKH